MIVNRLYRRQLDGRGRERVNLSNVTVLVGPNNVGKTQTLQDIRNIMVNDGDPIIFNGLKYGSSQSARNLLNDILAVKQGDRIILPGESGRTVSIDSNKWENWNNEAISIDSSDVFNTLSSILVTFLDAASRLQLATESEIDGSQSRHNPRNMALSVLYRSDEVYSEFQNIFQDVFGVTPVIDYSDQGSIRICIGNSSEEPPDHPRDLGLYLDQNSFTYIDEAGDGYLSFAGVVGSLLSSESRLVLLDEPAAFLHPSQARRLGEWVADIGAETAEQIVMTTHNANFLNGVLDSSTEVSIYRLNRTEEKTIFNQISNAAAERIATDPLLRSQRVLQTAFHTGAVICEGGSDRAVYEAVARTECDESDIQFIDGLGLSSLDKIARAAADGNIPVAAIVDLDILHPHRDLTNLLRGIQGGVGYDAVKPIIQEYDRIKKDIDTNALKNGIESIPSEHQGTVEQVLSDAAAHGVYLVPKGELESWMDLGVGKQRWHEEALKEISEGNCSRELREFVEDVLADIRSQYRSSG